MAVRQALVEIQADTDADLLDQLEQAYEDLEIDKANKETAAAEAEARRAEAESELTEVENALAQQQSFAAELEARLNAKLAEAESLRAFDAALADQLVREQAALAAWVKALQENEERERQAAAAAAAAALAAASRRAGRHHHQQQLRRRGWGRWRAAVAPSAIAPAPGGLARVSCPTAGRSRWRAPSPATSRACSIAAAQVALCGSGWRSPEMQIALREAHCGTSNYAIYQMAFDQLHAADGPAGLLDARAGPGRRLQLQRRRRHPAGQLLLELPRRPRQLLRASTTCPRSLALVDERPVATTRGRARRRASGGRTARRRARSGTGPGAPRVAEPCGLGVGVDGADGRVPEGEPGLLEPPVVDPAAVREQLDQLLGMSTPSPVRPTATRLRPTGQRHQALPADGGHLAPRQQPVAGHVEDAAEVVVEDVHDRPHHVDLVDELHPGSAEHARHQRQLQPG